MFARCATTAAKAPEAPRRPGPPRDQRRPWRARCDPMSGRPRARLGERLERATTQLGLSPAPRSRGRTRRRRPRRCRRARAWRRLTILPPRAPLHARRRPSAVLGLGFPVVRRVEPGALVTRAERLKDALDLLSGRRAADQAVLGDALLDLEGRAVLAAVDVHGHGQPRFFYAGSARALGPSALHPWRVTGAARRHPLGRADRAAPPCWPRRIREMTSENCSRRHD